MAAPIPEIEPEYIYSGDTLKFSKSIADYPATDGWALTYYFVPQGKVGVKFSFAASADGSSYSVSQSTDSIVAATYVGRAVVSKDSEKFTVWTGALEVLPSLQTDDDIRSPARRVLDDIEAAIAKNATRGTISSSVEGATFQFRSADDLLKLRDRYKQIVLNEDAKDRARAGKSASNNVYARFSAPR